jgi:hypothetical protein
MPSVAIRVTNVIQPHTGVPVSGPAHLRQDLHFNTGGIINLAAELEQEFQPENLHLSGADFVALISSGDTVDRVREIVRHRIVNPVPRNIIPATIRKVTRTQWGGTVADQNRPFATPPPAGRGKTPAQVRSLATPLNTAFLDFAHAVVSGNAIAGAADAVALETIIANAFTAMGR